MSYELYWYGDPWAAKAYRDADKLRMERLNQQLWLQGMYNYDGISLALSNAFRKKGQKAVTYRSKPYPLWEDTTKKDPTQEKERIRAALFFKNWSKATKNMFEK